MCIPAAESEEELVGLNDAWGTLPYTSLLEIRRAQHGGGAVGYKKTLPFQGMFFMYHVGSAAKSD